MSELAGERTRSARPAGRSSFVQSAVIAAVSLALVVGVVFAIGNGRDEEPVSATGTTESTASTAAPADATTTTGHSHGATDGGSAHEHATPETTVPKPAKPLEIGPDGLIVAAKVDLSGVPGVNAQEQARAEKLLKDTIKILPKWSDRAVAEADGFKSIGDGLTGEEHMLHWDWIEDDVILDPNYPESLVYKVHPDGSRTLEAAMFILPNNYTLENVPNVGGALTQFHIHDNLCFTQGDAPQVAGLTNGNGDCNPPLVEFTHNPQMHVWIRANECGPFASLLGVGAGQIKEGEERSCLHDHGSIGL
jgi:hypothetical protein